MDISVTNTSLFEIITNQSNQTLFTRHRDSLIKISREIEDGVIDNQVQARIFAGFQKLSFFTPHHRRYAKMAEYAEVIWIFGIPDVDIPTIPGVHIVPLQPTDVLASEWFLIAEASDYFSALVAKDLTGFEVPDDERLFRGIWTFDADTVQRLQQKLSEIVGLEPLYFTFDARDYVAQTAQFSVIVNDLVNSLEQRNERLVLTQKLRDQLVSMIVHDLRNPLAGMMGFVDLIERGIQRDQDPNILLELVAEVRRSHDDLSMLIDNILDLNRIEAGEFPIDLSKVALGPLLEEIYLQFRGVAQLRHLNFDVVLRDHDVFVQADEQALKRTLGNLLSNAMRYTRQGSVILKADPNHQTVEISVTDTGQGIAPDALERVFDPYFQAGSHRTRGTAGLGLAFCKHAVEAQHGEIWVESKIGEGSSFHIKLPRVQSPVPTTKATA